MDALARSGRLEEAALTFQKMHTYANHLGLYSEEIGLTGEQLGNFPQAFSHLSLINAAINLDYQLDHGRSGTCGRCWPGSRRLPGARDRNPGRRAGVTPVSRLAGPPGRPRFSPVTGEAGGFRRGPIMG